MKFLIILLLCFVYLGNIAYGQIQDTTLHELKKENKYFLESLEGKRTEISVVNDDGRSYGHCRILVICSKDTVGISQNWYGEVQVGFLNKNFLEITHLGPGGGSGLSYSYLSLICLQDNKPHIALDIIAWSSFTSGSFEDSGFFGEDYDTKISAINDGYKNIRLNISYHYKSEQGKGGADKLKNYHKHIVLNFDKMNNVFFQKKEHIQNNFKVRKFQDRIEHKANFNGTYPTIHMGSLFDYYFVNGIWYGWWYFFDKKGNLGQLTSKFG